MAGGEGTRLRPFTHTIPKPLLPIGRKPVAQLIIERLADHGFTEIIMSLGYAADLIRAYFQDGKRFGVRITYYQEKEKLGTAGCLAHLPKLREEPFLVTNGDLLCDLNYRDLLDKHVASNAGLTVAVRTETLTLPDGVLHLDNGNVTGVQEKPVHSYVCNAGIYALSPDSVRQVPADQPSDMTDLIARLLESGIAVRPYEVTGYWFDLAEARDFDRAIQTLGEMGLID